MAAFVATALLALVPLEQSQVQLILNIYPSQDNPTSQTVWIFSGSSTTQSGDSNGFRTSAAGSNSFQYRDSWYFGSPNNGNIFNANGPSRTNISLSPLLSSANAKDIASVNARIPGGGKTDITFAASATNTPTMTIGTGSRTISHLYMFDASTFDEMGIRVAGSSLAYSTGASSAWVGAGLIDKPIGDFFTGTYNSLGGVYFVANVDGSIQFRVNSAVIPEPEEYALVFGLFALGFVLLRRHWQKKKRQASSNTN